jgi:hypothetical protein
MYPHLDDDVLQAAFDTEEAIFVHRDDWRNFSQCAKSQDNERSPVDSQVLSSLSLKMTFAVCGLSANRWQIARLTSFSLCQYESMTYSTSSPNLPSHQKNALGNRSQRARLAC